MGRLQSTAARDKQILTACLRVDVFRAAEKLAYVKMAGYGGQAEVDKLVKAVVEYWNRRRATENGTGGM